MDSSCENSFFFDYDDLEQFSKFNFLDLPTLLNFFETAPCHFFCKDLDGNYIWCNKHMAQDLALPDRKNIIGLNDKELIWKKFSCGLRENDSHVLKTKNPTNFIEPVFFGNKGFVTLQSYKSPFYKDSRLFGILGISFLGYKNNNDHPLYNAKVYGQGIKTNNESESMTLSPRQIECIKLLMKGMSVKCIAKFLCLSPRTVETHITMAKHKLNCSNTAHLITTCLEKYKNLFYS